MRRAWRRIVQARRRRLCNATRLAALSRATLLHACFCPSAVGCARRAPQRTVLQFPFVRASCDVQCIASNIGVCALCPTLRAARTASMPSSKPLTTPHTALVTDQFDTLGARCRTQPHRCCMQPRRWRTQPHRCEPHRTPLTGSTRGCKKSLCFALPLRGARGYITSGLHVTPAEMCKGMCQGGRVEKREQVAVLPHCGTAVTGWTFDSGQNSGLSGRARAGSFRDLTTATPLTQARCGHPISALLPARNPATLYFRS